MLVQALELVAVLNVNVSIIISALNESETIRWAIEKAWSCGASEVIVVDGGSTDDTLQIARDCRCACLETCSGRARQQNAGADRAAGEVLLFQHADNWFAPQCVEQIKKVMVREKVLGGAFDQRIEAEGFAYRLLEKGNAARVRCLGLPYGDQGIFMRREVFFELGKFPEVELMEDLLLMKKLRRRSWPLLLPGPIYISPRRWKQNGVVRQTLRNWSLCAASHLGVSPHRLAKYYPHHRAKHQPSKPLQNAPPRV